MKALFYGGPRHNKIFDVPDDQGTVAIRTYKPDPRGFGSVGFTGPMMETVQYHRRIVNGRWEEGNILVRARADLFVDADPRKKFEPEKILRLAVRRKVAQVERTMLY